MKLILRFLKGIDLINEWSGRVFSFLIFALMILVVEEVVARYFFKSPHMWGLESSEFLLLIMTCLGGGYTLLHNGHVKVDILYAKFSVRGKAIADLIMYLIVLIVALVLVYSGGEEFWMAYTTDAVSFSGWPVIMWPFKLLIPIAGVLLGLQALAKWIRDLLTAVTGVKVESEVFSGEGGMR
jgi:TRAP-type mannitol/chloroaromatic compound transport system permease small subunit